MFAEVTIIGRLGKDPEMRFTPSGQAVTSFSVATDRQYKDQEGNPVKETTWWRVQAWGNQAESCNKYLTKGKLVMVKGRIVVDPKTGSVRLWTDQNGVTRSTLEIAASTVRFLSPKSEDVQPVVSEPTEDEIPPAEDIPF